MAIHSHNFVETYQGLVGFGADRQTDENTIIYYLQKFSDDQLMQILIKRLTGDELSEIFTLTTRLLKKHLTGEEYHKLFLKEKEK
jgi:peptide methionine sulfoxide reductase MsrA